MYELCLTRALQSAARQAFIQRRRQAQGYAQRVSMLCAVGGVAHQRGPTCRLFGLKFRLFRVEGSYTMPAR